MRFRSIRLRKLLFLLTPKRQRSPFCRDNPWLAKYSIGDWSYGAPRVLSWAASERLSIGRFCCFGGKVTVFLGGEHRTDRVSTYAARLLGCTREITENDTASKGDVRIGNDVWIGEGATVLSGVSIGNGAVVGAHSVVTKNVPSYAIVAGNPARLLRFRFSPLQVEALERISWWNWSVEDIRSSSHLLFSSEIDEFINLFDPLSR